MKSKTSPSKEDLSDDEKLLEEYGEASFNQPQSSRNPKSSAVHSLVLQVCHMAVFVLLFINVALLSVFPSNGRGAAVWRGHHDSNKCSSQPAEPLHPEESHDHVKHTTTSWRDCGHSAEEARAKGCVFDVILVAWLQPDCFDSELHEAYLSDHEYPFWLDRTLKTPITLEEVRLGKHATVYSSAEFHLAHCAYFMEQSVRGFRNGGMVDNATLENEHTEHCARSLRDHWLPEIGFSTLHMDYHSCGMPQNSRSQ